ATPARLDAWGDPLPPGALFRIGTLRAHPDVSYGARFSPDCKTITADGPDDTIRLLDAATGKDIRVFGDRAHRRISYWHSSDGKSLFTVGHDRTFRVWEVACGKERRRFTFPGTGRVPETILLAPSGAWVGSWDGKVLHFWNTTTGKPTRRIPLDANT